MESQSMRTKNLVACPTHNNLSLIKSHLAYYELNLQFNPSPLCSNNIIDRFSLFRSSRFPHSRYMNIPAVGKVLEIESLQKYILKIENDNKDDKLKLMIEDRINRFNFEFVRPSKDVHSDDILYAQGMKGMMAKGPELRMQIVPSWTQEKKKVCCYKNKGISRKEEECIQRRYTCK